MFPVAVVVGSQSLKTSEPVFPPLGNHALFGAFAGSEAMRKGGPEPASAPDQLQYLCYPKQRRYLRFARHWRPRPLDRRQVSRWRSFLPILFWLVFLILR